MEVINSKSHSKEQIEITGDGIVLVDDLRVAISNV
jgi:hypothetical protein